MRACRSQKFWGRWGPAPWDKGIVDNALETRYCPHVLSHQISSLCVKTFGRRCGVPKIWGSWAPLGWKHGWYPRNTHLPLCIITPNFVALDQTVWAWKLARTFWPLVSRLSRSLKVVGTDNDRSAACDFLFAFHSNHGPISYHFRSQDKWGDTCNVLLYNNGALIRGKVDTSEVILK